MDLQDPFPLFFTSLPIKPKSPISPPTCRSNSVSAFLIFNCASDMCRFACFKNLFSAGTLISGNFSCHNASSPVLPIGNKSLLGRILAVRYSGRQVFLNDISFALADIFILHLREHFVNKEVNDFRKMKIISVRVSRGVSQCPKSHLCGRSWRDHLSWKLILFSTIVCEILKPHSQHSKSCVPRWMSDRPPPVLFLAEQVIQALAPAPSRDGKEKCPMTLRKIQISAVAAVLFTVFLSPGIAQPTGRGTSIPNVATTKCYSVTRTANWTFEGCWTQFPAGPCRDIFRDDQGNYWICRACGTTGNPSPGKCNQISPATLASGFWCS
jgi:hypothetical protein